MAGMNVSIPALANKEDGHDHAGRSTPVIRNCSYIVMPRDATGESRCLAIQTVDCQG